MEFLIREVTKINELADLAELKISNDSNKNFSYINKSSDAPVKGQDIFIIGKPIRLEGTLSTGIISSIMPSFNKSLAVIFIASAA